MTNQEPIEEATTPPMDPWIVPNVNAGGDGGDPIERRSVNTPVSFDAENLLVGLAWLGIARTDQIRRLWLPGYHVGSVSRALHELRAEGALECRRWAVIRRDTPNPIQRGYVWQLSERGRRSIEEEDTYPRVYLPPRSRRLFPHDTMSTEVIVRLIELLRPHDLSGVYVERECRVDLRHRRPVMDALIALRLGGGFGFADLVPWTKDPLVPGETRYRLALENDRNTEAAAVIRGKAQAYRTAFSPEWQRKYGGFPLPLWLTPGPNRRQMVLDAWAAVWPDGRWLMTTDDDLASDHWWRFERGVITQGTLRAVLLG